MRATTMKVLNLRKEVKMSKTAPKCKWCDSPATKKEYRELNGVTSKIPCCDVCSELSTEFLRMKPEEKVKVLLEERKWYSDFADAVQANHRVYESACEYADEKQAEREGDEDE